MHGPMNEGESATNVKMLWIISSGRSEIIFKRRCSLPDGSPLSAAALIILSLSTGPLSRELSRGAEREEKKEARTDGAQGKPLHKTNSLSLYFISNNHFRGLIVGLRNGGRKRTFRYF